jgi:uncharacterized protein (DUF488 family)
MQALRGEILTVGHSTRPPGELEQLLRDHGAELVVDVRAHPGSRRMPHFGRQSLERSLADVGIEYAHVAELGGRRRPAPESPNEGWTKDPFRGYADHMASPEFDRGLAWLEDAAARRRACVMCAEAPWWRCHRRLLADALVVRGWSVRHIGVGEPASHELTEFAVVEGTRIVYPRRQRPLAM